MLLSRLASIQNIEETTKEVLFNDKALTRSSIAVRDALRLIEGRKYNSHVCSRVVPYPSGQCLPPRWGRSRLSVVPMLWAIA